MPIDLHKLVANYLRKIHTSQYLKAISCLMGWGGGGVTGGREGELKCQNCTDLCDGIEHGFRGAQPTLKGILFGTVII